MFSDVLLLFRSNVTSFSIDQQRGAAKKTMSYSFLLFNAKAGNGIWTTYTGNSVKYPPASLHSVTFKPFRILTQNF